MHIKSGLFIFNNAQDMVTSKFGIGIKNFLPLEALPHVPTILITSQKLDWGVVGENIKKIPVNPLSKDEVEEFLLRTFGLLECKDLVGPELLQLLQEFGNLFQGFILALSHAAAAIIRKSARDLASTDKNAYINEISPKLRDGINWYIARFNNPEGDWVSDPPGPTWSNDNKFIMRNVWSITFKKIKQLNHGTVALNLLSILAHLDPNHIYIAMCESIYYGKSYERYGIRLREQLTQELQEGIELLVEFSMISIEINESPEAKREMVRIHSLVQKCTRKPSRNLDALVKCLYYVNKYFKTCMLPSNHIYAVLEHSKEAKWPEETILLCLKICLKTMSFTKARCDYIYGYLNEMKAAASERCQD
ncbi:unnamed protein product, partial [Allacma fusca]